MRWGIRDEASQLTPQLCLNEIQRCQRESLGLNFIVGVGKLGKFFTFTELYFYEGHAE